MTSLRVTLAWIAAGLFALAAVVAVPIAMEAETLLASEDDPAAIADRALSTAFDRPLAIREIEAALAANDADLAKSFLELARERGVAVPPALADKVTAAVERANSTAAHVESFARGLITGEPENMVGLAGTALGDLFVYGDIRDAVREGARYVSGQPTDELVLGLAVVGLAITAGTYASIGAASAGARRALGGQGGAPHRAHRRRHGGLDRPLAARGGGLVGAQARRRRDRRSRDRGARSAHGGQGRQGRRPDEARRRRRHASRPRPARKPRSTGSSLRRDRARWRGSPSSRRRRAARPGRSSRRSAAARSCFRSPRSISRPGSLGAILTLFGFVSSAKSGVERLTQRAIDRGKERRQERYLAMTEPRA